MKDGREVISALSLFALLSELIKLILVAFNKRAKIGLLENNVEI